MKYHLSIRSVFSLLLIIFISGCSDVNDAQEETKEIDLEIDTPGWMSEAVIYEITPYNFVQNGTFRSITTKLPELKGLGINTIWVQPVTIPSSTGQGYDVVDYFEVNPDLGTEEDLHQLVDSAKNLGMRVLFDVVLNHTSIEHPYARDVIQNGTESEYYDYYQTETDNAPYSKFYNQHDAGFIYYFWDDLVNLNYDNEKVQQWMIDACKYWVEEYDIDGYRFDAIWGVNARKPAFVQKLIQELKNLKPDILLLAEDKGRGSNVFELGFDAAYDWTADTSWVSQWAWEYEYDHDVNLTVFNHPDSLQRKPLLQEALFENQENADRILRYIGNNDIPHFIGDHTLSQTKMVAALLFSLPGIPMLYNGQEIGKTGHPYSIENVFERGKSIEELDNKGLFDFYQQLIQLRKQHPALTAKSLEEVPVSSEEGIVAFHRSHDDQNFVVVLNLFGNENNVSINLENLSVELSTGKNQFRDVLSDETFDVSDSGTINVAMEGYSTRWLTVEQQ